MTTATADDDGALLDLVAQGDRVALRTLYDRHAGWLMARLARRCADGDIVDSAVQDTFVAVWRKPTSYAGTGEVAAWLWGIAIRRLIDQLRRQPRPTVPLDDVQLPAEEQILLGIEHGDLADALNRLSPELRAVVQATVLDGLTTKEAATLLGIPQGTVKTRMMRVRPQLREALA